jgi:hypothetical protein
MSTDTFVPLVLGLVLAVYLGMAVRTWRRLRGQRVVTCPETRRAAAVSVDVGHAMASAVWERADIRIAACSCWPEREGCDQVCVPQIEAAVDGTRTRAIAARSFEDRSCVMCLRRIEPLTRGAHQPGFMNPVTHEAVPWDEVPAQDLPDAIASRRALCRDCTFAESSRLPVPQPTQ